MQLRTFVVLIFLAFLLAFAGNKYMQAAGSPDSLKQRVNKIQDSARARADQLDKISKELERTTEQ